MNFVRRFILLTLTLLVLVSSTGISVGMHLCGGELRDISLLGGKSDCPMEQQQKETLPPCHQVPDDGSNADCCDDHTFVLQSHDVAADAEAKLLLKQPDIKFIAAFSAVILHLFEQQVALKPAFAHYSSPPLARDIPVLVQSFLI
ncbi:HYC_CC_PP family protein [Botryobacter ruber]|uniref:HYC_CC_PP family protein n=1 Tax=Botryobacter ruber TaxID=2171629 RepID=UPI000E0C36F6|nr:hypothetical protein [Botryobacter ruber]